MSHSETEKGELSPPAPIYTSNTPSDKKLAASEENPPEYDYPAEISRLVYLNMQEWRDKWQPPPQAAEPETSVGRKRPRRMIWAVIAIAVVFCVGLAIGISYAVISSQNSKSEDPHPIQQSSQVINVPVATSPSLTATSTLVSTTILTSTRMLTTQPSTLVQSSSFSTSPGPSSSLFQSLKTAPPSAPVAQEATSSAVVPPPAPTPSTSASSTSTHTAITSTVSPRVGFCGTPGMACAG